MKHHILCITQSDKTDLLLTLCYQELSIFVIAQLFSFFVLFHIFLFPLFNLIGSTHLKLCREWEKRIGVSTRG